MKVNILAAEDNDADVILFEEALAHHRLAYRLNVVTDGQQALQYIARMGHPGEPPCPDLLLLDLNLPKADGVTILSKLREHPECKAVPVIVVTSSDAEKDRVNMKALGATAYFRKPSDFEAFMELGDVIRKVLEPNTV